MAEIDVRISDLKGALAGLAALLGQRPEGEDGGSGLTGAAVVTADSPVAALGEVWSTVEIGLEGVLESDPAAAVTAVVDGLGALDLEGGLEPAGALGVFQGVLGEVEGAFSSDFFASLGTIRTLVDQVSGDVPTNPMAALEPLIQQALGVLASIEGPEAERIRAWIEALAAQTREILPLFASPPEGDRTTVILELMAGTLEGVLNLLGRRRLDGLFAVLEGGAESLVPEALVSTVDTALGATADAFAAVRAAVGTPDFEVTAAAAMDAQLALVEELRPVLSAVRRVVDHPLTRPGRLAVFLRRWMERALAVPVDEVQSIDDPYSALLDRIDEALAGIDLSAARGEILGFFENLRSSLESADLGSLGEALDDPLAELEDAVARLDAGVGSLLADVTGHFDQLLARQRQLLEPLGSFQPDGTFRYRFEDDLRAFFDGARRSLAGDPENPQAASLAGTLQDLQATLDDFFGRLEEMLRPVEEGAAAAQQAVIDGVTQLTAFLAGLDMPALIEALRARVEEMLDSLGSLDFDVVVDPVVAEIEEGAEALGEIDASQLNDLLREALAAALDVVLQVDFTVEITTPLSDELAAIQALPAQALDELQTRFEAILGELERLNPVALVVALEELYVPVREAVGELEVASLTAELDQLFEQHLIEPLKQLRPSALLAPASEVFDQQLAVLDGVSGTALVAPLVEGLAAVQELVDQVPVDEVLNGLQEAVADLRARLESIRPSELLTPVADGFSRLEAELERFRPSVVFAPVAALAEPLLALVEEAQADLVEGLFALFEAPLAELEQLRPQALEERLCTEVDAGLARLRAANLPGRFRQLKGAHFDLTAAVAAGGVEAELELAATLDPEVELAAVVAAYEDLLVATEGIKANLDLSALGELYDELRERLLALAPPYARQLLDVETFRRLMRQASPLRFLEELDQRFEELIGRLIPVRPEELGAELDAAYDAVLALVGDLDVGAAVARVQAAVASLRQVVGGLRVDFVAADIDAAVADLRSVLSALDPARLGADLDALADDLLAAVDALLPSVLLAGLDTPLAQVQGTLERVDPAALRAPVEAAWAQVQEILGAIDFRVVLSPLSERLDDLEAEFIASLARVETAFDQLLGRARNVLAGGGGASAGVSVGGGL